MEFTADFSHCYGASATWYSETDKNGYTRYTLYFQDLHSNPKTWEKQTRVLRPILKNIFKEINYGINEFYIYENVTKEQFINVKLAMAEKGYIFTGKEEASVSEEIFKVNCTYCKREVFPLPGKHGPLCSDCNNYI